MTSPRAVSTVPVCTCSPDEDDCSCEQCAALAVIVVRCPHVDEGPRSLYDKLCDRCFTAARDVQPCGLRLAEHAIAPAPLG